MLEKNELRTVAHTERVCGEPKMVLLGIAAKIPRWNCYFYECRPIKMT